MPAIKGKMQERGVARREAILDAAVSLMSSRGFRGTALSAVAEEVGLAETSVLHYFGSKDMLLVAVLRERQRRDAPDNVALAAGGGVDALRRFPQLARRIVADPSAARLLTVLKAEHLDGEGPIGDWFVRRARGLRASLAAVLRQGIDRGELRADFDVELKAAEIVGFLEGIQIDWLADPSAFDLVAAYESYFESLVRGLAAL